MREYVAARVQETTNDLVSEVCDHTAEKDAVRRKLIAEFNDLVNQLESEAKNV